jgi:hypothetical protein
VRGIIPTLNAIGACKRLDNPGAQQLLTPDPASGTTDIDVHLGRRERRPDRVL